VGHLAGVKCLLGMITQIEEGRYYLEDLTGMHAEALVLQGDGPPPFSPEPVCSHTGQIPLDLSQADLTTGIFTENCIVVIEGEVNEGAFRVDTMGFPPPETRSAAAISMVPSARRALMCVLRGRANGGAGRRLFARCGRSTSSAWA
jgi:DNA polymerase epsilon subunit 2